MGKRVTPERWKLAQQVILLVALVADEAAKLITALHG